MVSELAKTESGRREIIEKELRLRVVRKFDRRAVETRQYKTTIISFPDDRFRSADGELMERMLRLSAEAVAKDW